MSKQPAKTKVETWPFPTPGILDAREEDDDEEYVNKRATLLKDALRKIEPRITPVQKSMLLNHYKSPNMTRSVWKLAELAGFKGRGSRTLEYEKLVGLITDAANRNLGFGEYEFIGNGLFNIAKHNGTWDKNR